MNIKSAYAVKEFCTPVGWDEQGRITQVIVPGHQGRSYRVTITRNGHLGVSCEQIAGGPCQGNSNGTLCYHSLTTLMVAAEAQGYSVSWHPTEREASQNGEAHRVYSVQSSGTTWIALRGKVRKFNLADWATQLESLSWYDATLAQKVAKADLANDKSAQDALWQLVTKYPAYTKELVTLCPQAVLQHGREIRGLDREAEL